MYIFEGKKNYLYIQIYLFILPFFLIVSQMYFIVIDEKCYTC